MKETNFSGLFFRMLAEEQLLFSTDSGL